MHNERPISNTNVDGFMRDVASSREPIADDAFIDPPSFSSPSVVHQEDFSSAHDPEKLSSRPPSTAARPKALFREIAFLFALCSAQLLSLAGLGQGLSPASLIAATFDTTTPAQSSWFSASYTLTVGTFILIAGRAGDIWGHKRLLLAGYAWLALWSLLAGFSVYTKSIVFFDVCRAMQGVGSALTLPNAMALLGRAYSTGKQKNRAFAIFGACAPNGFLLGALFASLLAQLAWWPWAFWVMAIFSAGLVGAVMGFVPQELERCEGRGRSLKQMDWLGSSTGVAGLVFMNLSWNLAPIFGWSEPYVIVLLVMGVLAFCGFTWIERTTMSPILPIKSISRDALFVLLIIGLGWSSFGQALFCYFQFVQQLRHSTALSSVAQISGSSISGLLAAMTAGMLLSNVRMSIILLVASLAFCAGNILTATMPLNQSYWNQAFWIQIVMPWGMDMSFPVAAVFISDTVPKDQQGIAGSLVATVVNYSMSIGLGIAGTAAAQVERNSGDLLAQFRGAWYAGIGLSGCGVLLALYFASMNKRVAS